MVNELKDYGIVEGIRIDVLERMVLQRVCDKKILVAEGKPAQPGTDGDLKLFLDISGVGKPKEMENGSVDQKNLQKVINVKKDQPLMQRIPPQPGTEGCTVFGKPVIPAPPKDIVLKVGVGTKLSEANHNILVAATDGAVSINTAGDLEIKTIKIISGDIDYSTGNIVFYGDLRIIGVVRAGFSVSAEGCIYIGGQVESSQVQSTGDIEIIGGAVGTGSGKITCGGTLKIHYLENFSVLAGQSVLVADSILNSNVKSEAMVKAKTIIGGEVDASYGIESETIGSSSENRTILKVGSSYFLIQQLKLVQEKWQELQATYLNSKESIFALVRDGMDDSGKLPVQKNANLDVLKVQLKTIVNKLAELNQRIEQLQVKIKGSPNPVVKAGLIYPNTVIRFGLLEHIIREKIVNKVISADENRIHIRSA